MGFIPAPENWGMNYFLVGGGNVRIYVRHIENGYGFPHTILMW